MLLSSEIQPRGYDRGINVLKDKIRKSQSDIKNERAARDAAFSQSTNERALYEKVVLKHKFVYCNVTIAFIA